MSLNPETAIKLTFDAYADDRLAATELAPVDVGRPQRTVGRPALRRRSWRLQVAVVFALLAVVATTAWVLTRPSPKTAPPGSTAVLEVAGFTFDYPATLTHHDPEERYWGPSSVLAYLTDQSFPSYCQTTSTANKVNIQCSGPIATLASDKTLVKFTDFSLGTGADPSSFDTTIAGLPARIEKIPADQQCPANTATQISATIAYNAGDPGRSLVITGCFGADATTQQSFSTMLQTARYTPPTP